MPNRRLAPLLLVLSLLIALPSPASALLPARWPEAEALAHQLIACTRSGGWVRLNGTCDTVDAANRVPKRVVLRISTRIADEMARPYARTLSRLGYLSHSVGGSVQERFAKIGMVDGRGGENLGYSGGRAVLDAVIHIHRMFQSEWSYNGWHYRNLVDGRFKKIGVGVWVRGDRTYVVYDFHS